MSVRTAAVRVMVTGFVAFGLGFSGCSTVPRAPVSESGEKIEIYMLSNRGNPDEMTERQYRHRVEVGEWMQRDLLNMLLFWKRTYEQPDVRAQATTWLASNATSYRLKPAVFTSAPGIDDGHLLVKVRAEVVAAASKVKAKANKAKAKATLYNIDPLGWCRSDCDPTNLFTNVNYFTSYR